MVAPLRLRGAETVGPGSQNPDQVVGTSVYGLKEMSDTEIGNGIIYRMLKEFAKVSAAAPKTGDITRLETVDGRATTVIGDYVDTTRQRGIGTRDTVSQLDKVFTTEASIYQVLSTVTGTVVRPVCWRDGSVREMTDQEIFDNIIDPALNRLTNRGLGSYHFSSGAPRDPSGNILDGTWSSTFTVTDKWKSGTAGRTSAQTYVVNPLTSATFGYRQVQYFIAKGSASIASYTINATNTDQTTTYTMWRKTEDSTIPTTQYRPLKYVNSADKGKHLIEMSNADIISLLIPFRNAIITNGKGRYTFQATAPNSGVWSRRGDKVEDLLNVLSDSFYTWGYARESTSMYTGYFTTYYTGYYTGYFATTSTPYSAGYAGGTSTGSPYAQTFVGSYAKAASTRVDPHTYVAAGLTTYTTPIISADVLAETTEYLWVKREN